MISRKKLEKTISNAKTALAKNAVFRFSIAENSILWLPAAVHGQQSHKEEVRRSLDLR